MEVGSRSRYAYIGAIVVAGGAAVVVVVVTAGLRRLWRW